MVLIAELFASCILAKLSRMSFLIKISLYCLFSCLKASLAMLFPQCYKAKFPWTAGRKSSANLTATFRCCSLHTLQNHQLYLLLRRIEPPASTSISCLPRSVSCF